MTPALATLSPPCAESHPLDESTLCRRIACDGHHSADGTDWTTPTHDDARRTE